MAAAAAVAKVNPEKVEPAKVKLDKAKPEPDNAKPEKNLDLKRLSTRDLVRSFWRARIQARSRSNMGQAVRIPPKTQLGPRQRDGSNNTNPREFFK